MPSKYPVAIRGICFVKAACVCYDDTNETKSEGTFSIVKRANLRSQLLGLALGVVLVGGQLSGSAFAAPAKAPVSSDPSKNNANSIKVSPLRTDVALDPGGSAVVKIYVTNITDEPVVYKPIENDFVAGDEKGTPSIILDENSYAPSHSLKRFMVPLSNITVAAGAMQEVDLHIAVPKTAQAGGYFGAVRFAPAGSGNQPLVLASGVASLVLLTVSGPTVEQLTLTNFDVQQNGGTATNFRTPDDLSLLVRFQNKGNVQVAPFGQINVQQGKKVVYTYNFNQDDPKEEILPDSARRWQVPLKHLGKFGKYKISGTFGYGTKGTTINIEKTVWIIPTVYILAIVGGVVLLAVLVGGLFMFLRSYKRRILRSSRRRY